MRYDDYGEDDDYYDEEYSEEETDEVAAQYLWRGNDASVTADVPPGLTAHKNAAPMHNSNESRDVIALVEDINHILNMGENRDTSDKAVANANDGTSGGSGLNANDLSTCALSSKTPSAVGALFQDECVPNRDSRLPLETDGAGTSSVSDMIISGGRALVPAEGDVEPFGFDQPSPDDLFMAKRGRGRERMQSAKLRIPKPSQLRLPKPSEQSNGPLGPTKPPRQSAPQASSVSTQPTPASTESAATQKANKTNGKKGRKLRVPKKSQLKVPKYAQKQQEQNQAETSRSAAVQNGQMPKSKKVLVQRVKSLDLTKAVETRSKGKTSVSIVVAGHVDAGKSTLLGQLLTKVGGSSAKFSTGRKGKERGGTRDLAWLTDEDELERTHGVTIDICTRLFATERNGKTRHFAMVDAPGHRDFVPAMIIGAMQASAAVLVVDASLGEFEAGVSENGQTREHALLLRAMGVTRLIVAVNKLDMVDYDKKRYNEVVSAMRPFLKSTGWNPRSNVSFVPVAGRAGVNVVSSAPASCGMKKWYKGPTFLQSLETLADEIEDSSSDGISELSKKPTRLMVLDSFRSVSLGGVIAVSGRLLAGSIAPRDVVAVGPWGDVATVKTVEVRGERAKVAIAGVDNTPVSVSLTDIPDTVLVSPGNVLCDPVEPVPVVTKLRAQMVVIASSTPLLPGSAVEMHVGGGCEVATLHKLVELCGRGKGEGKPKRPRRLVKNDSAIVEIKTHRAVCLERAADVKALGRFTLRSCGRTVAAGIVLEILKTKKASSGEENSADKSGTADEV